jgi:DNA-binding LacI/PurR family transcriptional regulator
MEPTSRQKPRRATIEDVAAAANVSVATVSRALRGLPNVAPSTRARVGEAATGLNHQPDPAASRLAAGATTTLLVMVPSTSSWYFAQVIAGAEAVAAETSHDFLAIGVRSLEQRDRLLDEAYRLERRADGVPMVNIGATDDQATSLRRRGIGLATIGTRAPGCPAVQVDDEAVGRLAAEHLVGLGHRRLGVIGGSLDDPLSFDVPLLRRRGFAAGLPARGWSAIPICTSRATSTSTAGARRWPGCSMRPIRPRRCSPCPTRWPSAD